MGSSTRSAWNSFVGFTQKHEETHRGIYVQCGNNFVAKAERLTASNCARCRRRSGSSSRPRSGPANRKQRAFDRADTAASPG